MCHLFRVPHFSDSTLALLTAVIEAAESGAVLTTPIAYVFYHGPSLPSGVFGELLAIPGAAADVGPRSYSDFANMIVTNGGLGQLMGATALAGGEAQYVDMLDHWQNFSGSLRSTVSTTLLALTPVPLSQITVGYARGGNAIAPPSKPYTLVLFQEMLDPRIAVVPQDLLDGKLLLYEQYVDICSPLTS
jgi:hypothetical protein